MPVCKAWQHDDALTTARDATEITLHGKKAGCLLFMISFNKDQGS